MAKKKAKTPINVQNKQVEPFIYQATLVKVVDGDTIDVTLDLGFNVLLHNQRVRLAGIDTPESRTRNLEEKKLGLAAKERLKEILAEHKFKIQSLGKGKYGRILGIPHTDDGQNICNMLIEEGHAREYDGGKRNLGHKMRAFEFLTEYKVKGQRDIKYRDGGKPPWYEKAVKLKTDNPRMSASEIGRQLGVSFNFVLRWLTGVSDNEGRISNDNPPFTIKDFPAREGTKKYFDGAKPWWYEEAIKLRKQGMMYKDIANKLSTPEESISKYTIRNWLVKGTKHSSGKLINPDAPFEPTFKRKKPINTDLIKKLIDDGKTDEEIIERMIDQKGNKIANQIKAIIPQLRQKLNPGTSVIDKTRTGAMKDPDITGFVQ